MSYRDDQLEGWMSVTGCFRDLLGLLALGFLLLARRHRMPAYFWLVETGQVGGRLENVLDSWRCCSVETWVKIVPCAAFTGRSRVNAGISCSSARQGHVGLVLRPCKLQNSEILVGLKWVDFDVGLGSWRLAGDVIVQHGCAHGKLTFPLLIQFFMWITLCYDSIGRKALCECNFWYCWPGLATGVG